ncbi:phosphatidylinositol-glycan-specific phospholipase D-like isoform X2 [Mya arenaria]|uniref:phosphatidylinositol-glycan-specific phospholipase D-like isoform X2 n=1 Tax=Mya arenaria TaxID=6604 RepID=UPI0022E4A0F0|nr:phosphatidylinositol-glycan-specific phospholipase D-like isoform X2 [Mya arenaria]
MERILVFAFLVSLKSTLCNTCGVLTHIEISHRAQQYFQDSADSNTNYGEMIRNHQDALMAGSPYPDAYYDVICANGMYHDVSEDTHWAPFLNATANYITSRYPKPWDDATQKLVVFMFGVVSHQVADILWHSLGIDRGFIQAMANINFHSHFSDAHTVADFGGDIMTAYEMDTSYIPLEEGWYLPLDDLYEIYGQYYDNKRRVPKPIIAGCSVQLFVERLAENLAAKELFPDYADQSPFLVDQFEDYFEGGVGDMAVWTDRIWHEAVIMFDQGTQKCDIPHSTLFLHCNTSEPRLPGYRPPGKNGYFKRPNRNGVSKDDVVVQSELRGIRIKPSMAYLEKLKKHRLAKVEKAKKVRNFLQEAGPVNAEPRVPDSIFYVSNDYARLGEAYATGDLNSDGHTDLVISAPGYSNPGNPQDGRVYIIYGDESGIPRATNPNLDDLAQSNQGQILNGFIAARFGTSVAVLDVNMDGVMDLAVGAPAFVNPGDNPLLYNGLVLIYFGDAAKHRVFDGAANITLACTKYEHCNLGFSLTVGDVNADGNPDLVVGAPIAPSGGEQRGMVVALLSSKDNTGYQYIEVDDLKWTVAGDQDSGWFGYDINMRMWNGKPTLMVGQPEFRQCDQKYNPNCTKYEDSDDQSSGRLTIFYGPTLQAKFLVEGQRLVSEFQEMGWSSDIGSPYIDPSTQVIAVTSLGAKVDGRILTEEVDFEQAGKVLLYNTTNGFLPTQLNITLMGDRRYGRFGAKVRFLDVTGDGMDDLVVGAPLRSEDITEEFYGPDQGVVYIYNGGGDFPYDSTLEDCTGQLVKPCPALQASTVLTWNDKQPKTRFGSNFAYLKAQSSRQLFVTAQHSSQFARLAGAVGVFNFM